MWWLWPVRLPAGLSALGLVGHAPPTPTAALSIALPGRTRNPGRGFDFGRCHCLPLPVSVRRTLRGDDHVFRDIAREWSDPGGYAVVGCERREGAMGAITTTRFANTPLRLLLNFITAAFGSFAVAVTMTVLFAAVLISVLSLRAAERIIAFFAPGWVKRNRCCSRSRLNLDPVSVGAHHLTRIFFVSLTMPIGSPPRTARSLKVKSETAKPLTKRPPFQD